MIYDDRDRVQVRNAALVVTAVSWVVIVARSSVVDLHARQHAMTASSVSPRAALEWLLMMSAMMTPVLIHPIQFIRGSSLARRRTRYAALFVTGYIGVWMLVGWLFHWFAAATRSFGLPPYVFSAVVLLTALIWQCSPAKQACLNRCHALWRLTAFCRTADTGMLTFGATHGIWCAGSCWAWMLLPLSLSSEHFVAMAGVGALIFCERLDNPAPARWRWRGFGTARRLLTGRVAITTRANAAV